jgi:ribosome maturation factor RimP
MITENAQNTQAPEAKLTAFLESKLSELEYELVAVEILNHREKKLRIFIDQKGGVSIEDCVKVTHELDQPLEMSPEIANVFKGEYELEVSSPGLDRPLRKSSDYDKFAGKLVRLSTFRPLTANETKLPLYCAKNPKQKKFFGFSRGFETETASILFGIVPEDGTGKKPKTETLIRIPLELVAKANLEPEIEIGD